MCETCDELILPSGPTGDKGWSPVPTGVADGERWVIRIDDWVGGSGIKPDVGKYISTTGLTTVLASAVDFRGAKGWAPVFNAVNDGANRVVLQLSAWVGGTGPQPTTPTIGQYVSGSGYTSTIGSATNIKGAGATITVGSTTTGLSGTNASVVNAGTSTDAILNFTIPRGADGRSITSVTRTSGNGSPGTTDTYTITYSDATTSTFTVYNGSNGTNGTNGTNATVYMNTGRSGLNTVVTNSFTTVLSGSAGSPPDPRTSVVAISLIVQAVNDTEFEAKLTVDGSQVTETMPMFVPAGKRTTITMHGMAAGTGATLDYSVSLRTTDAGGGSLLGFVVTMIAK